MARRAALLLALLAAGCSESPFAPAPSPQVCGSRELPCPFDCQLACASQAVMAAASCALTLEGDLDPSRTRCRFADGSQVIFAQPVPVDTSALRDRGWGFSVQHGSEPCLEVSQESTSTEAGLVRRATTLRGPAGEFGQELWSSRTAGGAAGALEMARVRCSDGRYHQGAAGACSACSDGGCRLDGLLELRFTLEDPLELTLMSGDHMTPLFTCR